MNITTTVSQTPLPANLTHNNSISYITIMIIEFSICGVLLLIIGGVLLYMYRRKKAREAFDPFSPN